MKGPKKTLSILVTLVVTASLIAFFTLQKNDEGMLIHALRAASQPSFGKYRENLDDVVLEHIALGTQKAAAMAVCDENGFKVSTTESTKTESGLVSDEFVYCTRSYPSLAYLISSKEYRVILYMKDEKVIATVGRFFLHTL